MGLFVFLFYFTFHCFWGPYPILDFLVGPLEPPLFLAIQGPGGGPDPRTPQDLQPCNMLCLTRHATFGGQLNPMMNISGCQKVSETKV